MIVRLMRLSATVLMIGTLAAAQAPSTAPTAQRGPRHGGPMVVSPQIEKDGRVTFRIFAPQASTVAVTGDIGLGLVAPAPSARTPRRATDDAPGRGSAGVPAVVMAKGADGVWSGTTIRPIKPGAWRYLFNVDGVATVDPRNTDVSPNQRQVRSILYVPGDFSETRDVPHGAISAVRYVAATLGNARREMYVYTPPGYGKSAASYPVLYLIHGGGDAAISWSTIGRANDILDNLIAEKKAKPMIVVMPSG